MPISRKNITILLIVLAAAAVTVFLLVKFFVLDRTVESTPGPVKITAADRVLIVAPHPDDETLGPGIIASQAAAIGATVKAVIVTEGDAGTHAAEAEFKTLNLTPGDYLELGRTRHKESLAAMKGLGIDDVVFLGFADGSTNSLWRQNWDDSNSHLGRNGKTAVPYDFAADPGAVYSGDSLARSLAKVITDYKPTVIFFPTPEDLHHDHWAVNAFTQYVLAKHKVKAREYTYLVHRGGAWPTPPLYMPGLWLQPPTGLTEVDAEWVRFVIDDVSRQAKLEAINKYVSQTTVNGVWLRSFIRKNELFAIYPDLKTSAAAAPPAFKDDELEGLVLNDHEAFDLSQSQGGKGDIKQYGFSFDKDYIYAAVRFDEPMPNGVVTMFNMRFFTSAGVDRLDIRVLNGEAAALDIAENSVLPKDGITLIKNGAVVAIRIPADVIGNAETMMLNVDTFDAETTEDNWLDRTVWRRITLK
jgi:LmbE family N-acetylglucosaminyl deacetylase